MAPIITTTEIARSAEEVFAYVTDPSKMREWQQGCARIACHSITLKPEAIRR
jgi:uncharacterized protein YndB with AHSA1/START domain